MNTRKKVLLAAAYVCCFVLLSGVYLFAAVIWDEMENEIYIYNYDWNFGLIDFCLWKAIPALGFCFLMWRIVAIFKNHGVSKSGSKRI